VNVFNLDLQVDPQISLFLNPCDMKLTQSRLQQIISAHSDGNTATFGEAAERRVQVHEHVLKEKTFKIYQIQRVIVDIEPLCSILVLQWFNVMKPQEVEGCIRDNIWGIWHSGTMYEGRGRRTAAFRMLCFDIQNPHFAVWFTNAKDVQRFTVFESG
jgi:hypothetical protein